MQRSSDVEYFPFRDCSSNPARHTSQKSDILDAPRFSSHRHEFLSVFFRCCGAFFLLALNPSLMVAGTPQGAPDIQVHGNGFGQVSPADITAVLQSAALSILRYCPHTQLGGIDIYYRPDHPQIALARTSKGRIPIALSARDTRWAQYSFQLGHELCHALANYANRPGQSAPRPGSANLWLEESLCETASLFTLRAMSRSWSTAPLYPAWRNYAPWFDTYVKQRLQLPGYQLPAGTSFRTWFEQNEPGLRQNPGLRNQNTVIATQLLPMFEATPEGWETVAFINRDSSDSNESLLRHFTEWRAACPNNLRPFVTRLASVFSVKL
ncbi:MAG: hypothetical protein JO271_16240 [Verrucomicrobia bacterium]|nr:hypothetical protein [Verrucomicrobiota bacterium]